MHRFFLYLVIFSYHGIHAMSPHDMADEQKVGGEKRKNVRDPYYAKRLKAVQRAEIQEKSSPPSQPPVRGAVKRKQSGNRLSARILDFSAVHAFKKGQIREVTVDETPQDESPMEKAALLEAFKAFGLAGDGSGDELDLPE